LASQAASLRRGTWNESAVRETTAESGHEIGPERRRIYSGRTKAIGTDRAPAVPY